MGSGERLSDEVLGQIVGAMQAAQLHSHDCKFVAEDRENIHELCRVLRGGGLDAIREMIVLSRQISASKRIIWGVTLAASATGALTVFAMGVRAWIRAALGR
jgi:hypothetical protein